MAMMLSIGASAQNVDGISLRIKSRPMVVYIDDTPISDLTFSCFIAGSWGTYRIRVDVPADYGQSSRMVTIFKDVTNYSGRGILILDMEKELPYSYCGRGFDYDDYFDSERNSWGMDDRKIRNSLNDLLHPIPARTYNELVEELRDCSFDSDYKRAFRLLPRNAGICAEQFKNLCKIPTFDSGKKIIALRLVPHIMDIENCANIGDIFSFLSTRDEVINKLRSELEVRYRKNGRISPHVIWQ